MEFQPEILLAQTAPGPGGGGVPFFLMMGAVLLIMYALMIRPQQRQEKERQAMLGQLEKGDTIVTSGGIHGRITGITDDVLTVEIADRVRIKVDRVAVAVRNPGQPARQTAKNKPKEAEKKA